jgi:hypothetical protein
MAVLFGKLKAGEARNTVLEMFKHVAAQTVSPVGYALIPKDLAEKAIKAEPTVLLINPTVAPDANGMVQAKATPQGIAALNGSAAVAAPAASTPKQVFKITEGIPLPPTKRGGIRESTYPFDSLPVGGSFFVAATEKVPNPAKPLGSTVSSANKRFAAVYPATVGKDKKPHPKAGQPTGKDGRKFAVRPRTVADGEESNGARIWRIQ